ncbi:hypothetical protein OIV83_000173 [Microbotryomycetes sp. JL201]|nr:hypothetical protein OIV83_000173 [Microbotryomycetes sp. JL201]
MLPRDGVGASVYQTRWHAKGLPVPRGHRVDETCRWDVKRVRLNLEGDKVTGRAYGIMYWKGKRVTPAEKEYEEIKGGLKYNWAAAVPPPALVQLQAAAKAKQANEAAAE